MTVPVRKASLSQTLAETQIDGSRNWRRKMLQTVRQSYAACSFPDDLAAVAGLLEEAPDTNLAVMNMFLIEGICELAGIEQNFVLSEALPATGKRTGRLIEILEYLNASVYFSPAGAEAYLLEDDFSDRTDVSLVFSSFVDRPYRQLHCDTYQGKLSVVDIVANLGFVGLKEYADSLPEQSHNAPSP